LFPEAIEAMFPQTTVVQTCIAHLVGASLRFTHRGRRSQTDLPRHAQRCAPVDRTRGWTKALLASKIHFGDRVPD
jgi:acyl-CoA thioesterase FadM